ncbi:predicted protein [Streptomyces viridosporus ATCC 14672]|uniref:Predicted protein n=1 Tax=Streptomyces viridosporus (strain ATCC 14672 / DSM 40746 / JCM 4963 / KCTC 9882 / NRRL B-12104 / FH 1290) TaxID=566461 RepID=D5ZXP4_STRV1|nr:predicted protein [Streptomyces viridosporus ATCC 14672]
MVVDDQDSDANHETPFPKLSAEQGITHRRRTTPARVRRRALVTDFPAGHGTGRRNRTAAAAGRPPPRLGRRTRLLSPPERRRPPPALFIRVRARPGSGRLFAELAALRVYGEPHVPS